VAGCDIGCDAGPVAACVAGAVVVAGRDVGRVVGGFGAGSGLHPIIASVAAPVAASSVRRDTPVGKKSQNSHIAASCFCVHCSWRIFIVRATLADAHFE